jgi:HSP90 family molecular chaperone
MSNASDAIDKRHFRSLTEPGAGLDRSEYADHDRPGQGRDAR